jgi:hypothetical protein
VGGIWVTHGSLEAQWKYDCRGTLRDLCHIWKQQKSKEEKRSRTKINLSSGCPDAEFFELLCHLKEDYALECKIVMRNGKLKNLRLQMTMVKTMEAQQS